MASVPGTLIDNWLTILLSMAVSLTLYVYSQWGRKSKGPCGLPYVGYYPFLSGNSSHLDLAKLIGKYGEAFCFTVTGQTYVHLGSVKSIREAHVTKSHCFSERPSNFSLIFDAFGDGVGFLSGEKWKVLRKFFVQLLREYGMGKKTVDDMLGECLEKTVDSLRNTQGRNFDALTALTAGTTEIVKGLLFRATKVNSDDVADLIETYKQVMKSMEGKKQLLSGPLLKYVMLNFIPEYQKYRENKSKMYSVFIKIIREHEKGFDKDNLRDLVDCYIHEKKLLEEQLDPKAEIFSERALASSLVQFFGDGALSLGYLVASVLKDFSQRPEVQKEIQREVDEVVGRNRSPSWSDKNSMPYTNAAIWETLRICSFIPAFPSLQCTEETTVCGNFIPKGAVTLVNFWAALHDPNAFEEPDKYDPTRFLPTEGKKAKSEWPMVFGVGKRACIGEQLVNMETFLFVTTVLQNFDIFPAEEGESESPAKNDDWIEFNIELRATARAS